MRRIEMKTERLKLLIQTPEEEKTEATDRGGKGGGGGGVGGAEKGSFKAFVNGFITVQVTYKNFHGNQIHTLIMEHMQVFIREDKKRK